MGTRGLAQVHRFKADIRFCLLCSIACILALSGIVTTIGPAQAHRCTNLPVSGPNPLSAIDPTIAIRIDINSDPPGITSIPGSGEYAAGELVRLSAPAIVEDIIKTGVQYRFVRWKLPNGETMSMANLSVMVNESGTFTADYDTYYQLSLKSNYPKVDQTSWYAAGSTAEYSLAQEKAPMPGIPGFLGGFKKATNPQDTHLMDGPYTVNITWTDDYTMPLLIITVVLLLVIGLIVFSMFRRHRTRGQAAPAPEVKELPQPQVQDTAVTEVHVIEEIPTAPPAAKPNFCPDCGDPVTERENFCAKCGRKLI